MTIQQLEYILAVDQFRHFARAAEYCRVTQPTLSAMIQKLEDELGVKLFDRTVQPVCPTTIGQKVIDQARVILAQAAQVKDIISEVDKVSNGEQALNNILQSISYLIGEERKILSIASQAGDEVTVSMMSDYLKEQEKLVWMLTAYNSK